MIKRILEISHTGTYLSVKYNQLKVKRDSENIASIPCEDIGVLLVDSKGVVYTHSVLTKLLDNGAAVVLCNGQHHPAGMVLPLENNTLQSERFRDQINAKLPLKKRLWKQLVKAKIAHQAKLVRDDAQTYKWLIALKRKVRSGDTGNIEAQASKRFWQSFFQNIDFRRNPEGKYPNNLLNYGYMVMRAAVARALCCAGLLPTVGIHHKSRYNAYCLADDMIEPFRGYVEKRVKQICETEDDVEELSQRIKAELLEVLYEQVEISGYKGPLMVGLHRTMASLQRCFAGEQKKLELPKL